jgi:hypothetical protein
MLGIQILLPADSANQSLVMVGGMENDERMNAIWTCSQNKFFVFL